MYSMSKFTTILLSLLLNYSVVLFAGFVCLLG